jgi:glutaminase
VISAKFGFHITKIDSTNSGIGHHFETFSIHSIAKLLSLTFAVKFLGERIWTRVGVEPSETKFDSFLLLKCISVFLVIRL